MSKSRPAYNGCNRCQIAHQRIITHGAKEAVVVGCKYIARVVGAAPSDQTSLISLFLDKLKEKESLARTSKDCQRETDRAAFEATKFDG